MIMHTLVNGLKLIACWTFGFVAAAVVAADAVPTIPQITPNTPIPIGTAVGIGVACITASMWLARRLTVLQASAATHSEELKRLENRLNELPCHTHADCSVNLHPK